MTETNELKNPKVNKPNSEDGIDPCLVVRSMGEKRQRRLAARREGRRRLLSSAVYALVFVALIATVKTGLSHNESRRAQRVAVRHKDSSELPVRTPAFAHTSERGLPLRLPAVREDVIAIGYHQAYNTRSLELISEMGLIEDANRESISGASAPGRPAAFQMDLRGRGSAPTSSVDVAVKAGTLIKSPVTGTIEAVAPYLLYGQYEDVRIEIAPAGYGDILVAIVHLDRPIVTVGQHVEAGITPLALPRKLVVNSQIDQYLGKITEHIHLQINPRNVREVAEGGY